MDRDEMDVPDLSRDHQAALETMRYAKNGFLWLALAAVMVHVLAYGVVRYSDRLAPLRGSLMFNSAVDPRTSEPVVYDQAEREAARRWQRGLESALVMAGFVGRAAVLILAGIFVTCLLIALTARLGGAAGLARTCVWTLAALAMLTPWAQLPSGSGVGSAFFGFDEVAGHATGSGGLVASVRYLMCPLLVAGFLIAAHVHFSGSIRRITGSQAGLLPIHEV